MDGGDRYPVQLISETVRFEEAEQAFKDVKAGKGIKMLIAGPNEK